MLRAKQFELIFQQQIYLELTWNHFVSNQKNFFSKEVIRSQSEYNGDKNSDRTKLLLSLLIRLEQNETKCHDSDRQTDIRERMKKREFDVFVMEGVWVQLVKCVMKSIHSVIGEGIFLWFWFWRKKERKKIFAVMLVTFVLWTKLRNIQFNI